MRYARLKIFTSLEKLSFCICFRRVGRKHRPASWTMLARAASSYFSLLAGEQFLRVARSVVIYGVPNQVWFPAEMLQPGGIGVAALQSHPEFGKALPVKLSSPRHDFKEMNFRSGCVVMGVSEIYTHQPVSRHRISPRNCICSGFMCQPPSPFNTPISSGELDTG